MASWSKERVAALKELAATDLTLREIGERMKERFGIACTKDSVKRTIDGLGLSRRTNRWSDERVAVLTDLAAKNLPDYTPSSAKFGHRTNHEKSNVLRFSPRLLTHRRPSPGRTIDQVARLKEGIYHI